MSSTGLSDEQLMVRAAHKDPAALELLYDRYAPAVMGLALKMIGDRALAEEVVQETFWRVWRNADSFREQRGSFPAWLFGIARNLTIDMCRRRKVRPQPARDDAEEQKARIQRPEIHEEPHRYEEGGREDRSVWLLKSTAPSTVTPLWLWLPWFESFPFASKREQQKPKGLS